MLGPHVKLWCCLVTLNSIAVDGLWFHCKGVELFYWGESPVATCSMYSMPLTAILQYMYVPMTAFNLMVIKKTELTIFSWCFWTQYSQKQPKKKAFDLTLGCKTVSSTIITHILNHNLGRFLKVCWNKLVIVEDLKVVKLGLTLLKLLPTKH